MFETPAFFSCPECGAAHGRVLRHDDQASVGMATVDLIITRQPELSVFEVFIRCSCGAMNLLIRHAREETGPIQSRSVHLEPKEPEKQDG